MKKKKTKKIDKDKLVFYRVKPFEHDIVFYYSDDFKKLKNELNKKKHKDISDYLAKILGKIDYSDGDGAGGLTYPNDKKLPCLIWICKKKKRDWNLYENIIHEIVHIMDFLDEYFGFDSEKEFRAYLTTCMFRDFRRIIDK